MLGSENKEDTGMQSNELSTQAPGTQAQCQHLVEALAVSSTLGSTRVPVCQLLGT